ncbi:hypothetical protein [Dokdonella sp.]|uniref:hypothetical protein n=1 Tax=Dokdonella sp. TaxID=2291710 RepID=UPI0025BD6778|nr:hypothetical protein [Dokdonella sp.]MBX3688965.1 hypothetical protein [Dokdonella sp.]
MNRKTHTLYMLGATADQNTVLTRLLDNLPDRSWQMGTADSADLLLVDVDSVYGHMDWLKAQSTGRPVAAVSSGDAHSAEYHLRKPFSTSALAALLADVAARVPAVRISAAPPVAHTPAPTNHAAAAVTATPIRPAPAAPVQVEAAAHAEPPVAAIPAGPQTLLDLLGSPEQPGKRWRLRHDGQPALVLDGSHQLAYAEDVSLKALSPWCSLPLDAIKLEQLDATTLVPAIRNQASLPYARLSWLAHLLGSNGQLEAQLDPAGRYKLARWPQSEREFPKHFRIATAMMKAHATVEEIAEASGSSAADVANFINAYNASGHIEAESSDRDAGAEQRRSGLFGRNR